jgi:hypothetical protein
LKAEPKGAVVTTQDTHWTAWHLHVTTLGAGATDQVVRHVVGPAADAVRQWGVTAGWFFVRYWQAGPHVRLRVAGLDSEQEAELDALVRDRMTELAATAGTPLTPAEYRRQAAPLAAAGEGGVPLEVGELWPAGVYRQLYRPELARYGGLDLLPVSESLFHQSSELALQFLRLDPPEAARSGLGLRATQAAVHVLADDDQRRQFCTQAAATWQDWAQKAGGGKIPVPRPRPPMEGRTPAPVRRWADQLGQAMTLWRDACRPEEAPRMLHAHIHMLHNRLGLSVGQERNHFVALAGFLSAGVTAVAQ